MRKGFSLEQIKKGTEVTSYDRIMLAEDYFPMIRQWTDILINDLQPALIDAKLEDIPTQQRRTFNKSVVITFELHDKMQVGIRFENCFKNFITQEEVSSAIILHIWVPGNKEPVYKLTLRKCDSIHFSEILYSAKQHLTRFRKGN